jgi:hypothetical protein
LLVVTIATAVLAAGVDGAGATNECRGFLTCVPVAGPWVVVPASRAVPRPEVQYQLTCPKGFIVGGVDAELTDPAIDVSFLAIPASPVAPGRVTARTIVFVARYVGNRPSPPTFRPHAGCIPASGGGRRTPTAVIKVVPPGKPTVRRVRTFRIKAPRAFGVTCHRDERLVAAYSAVGFRTAKPPSQQLISSVTARPALALTHIVVDARGGGGRAVVQLAAVCAGGR